MVEGKGENGGRYHWWMLVGVKAKHGLPADEGISCVFETEARVLSGGSEG